MSLQNIGGSGPLKPGNAFNKLQLPKAATPKPNAPSSSGDKLQIGFEARSIINQAVDEPSIATASPIDLIRGTKNLAELVDKIVEQEFPGTLPEKHLTKLKEFIGKELERLGLDFNQIKKSA
ncbi:MAG TPA: hypothetical protein DD435_07130 [Cyanobacteria bacterium UBA8530]|nr:hypothetical protein [Cyanobacteria bacterium UBA8530]